jgi:hypothetical protein
LWHSELAKGIEDLWEPWMKEVDQLLEDAALVRVCTMRKESAIRRAVRAVKRKHRRK